MPKSAKKIAALFINMGGPRSIKDVSRFMHALFNDIHIIDTGQPMRTFIARMITLARVKGVRANYSDIECKSLRDGQTCPVSESNNLCGGSPIFCWTEKQGRKTVEKLTDQYPNLTTHEGYSYSAPFIYDTIGKLAQKHDEIVVVPLYPYYSIATLGSMYSDIERARKTFNLGDRIKIVPPYYDKELHINGTIELLKNVLKKTDPSIPYRVVFTAHSLPMTSITIKGDPYRQQVEQTYKEIIKRHPIENSILAFQSKIGPVEWMGPSTENTIIETGKMGFKQVVVMPIGFTCDHIETIHELDIELRETAEESGIELFHRGNVFNDHNMFTDLLAQCIQEALE